MHELLLLVPLSAGFVFLTGIIIIFDRINRRRINDYITARTNWLVDEVLQFRRQINLFTVLHDSPIVRRSSARWGSSPNLHFFPSSTLAASDICSTHASSIRSSQKNLLCHSSTLSTS